MRQTDLPTHPLISIHPTHPFLSTNIATLIILIPDIYGGIPAVAVMDRYRIIRGDDGSFLSIEGIC